jgi:hypothetical protein
MGKRRRHAKQASAFCGSTPTSSARLTKDVGAVLRSIVRRDTGESYQDFLTKLAQASGIETPTRTGWQDADDDLDQRRTEPRLANRR